MGVGETPEGRFWISLRGKKQAVKGGWRCVGSELNDFGGYETILESPEKQAYEWE